MFEAFPFSILEQLVRPGAVVYDCGANIGLYARYLVATLGASRVVSFEPDEDNLALLAENRCPWRHGGSRDHRARGGFRRGWPTPVPERRHVLGVGHPGRRYRGRSERRSGQPWSGPANGFGTLPEARHGDWRAGPAPFPMSSKWMWRGTIAALDVTCPRRNHSARMNQLGGVSRLVQARRRARRCKSCEIRLGGGGGYSMPRTLRARSPYGPDHFPPAQ